MSRELNMQCSVKLLAKLVAVGTVVALSGCSLFSSKKEVNPPAELVQFKQVLDVKKAWSASLGKSGAFVFTPALYADDVFAASADGTIVRLNAQSGQVIWRIKAGKPLTAGVGTDGNTVAVVGEKGLISAFDGQGKLRWTAQASSEVLSAPAVGQGLVIVRSIDNQIAAYDAESGVRRWVAQRTVPALTLRTAPGIVVTGPLAVVALPGGRLSALTLNNGGPQWEAAIGEPRGTTELERISDASGVPAVIGTDVCAVAYQGRIGCFDLRSGNAQWLKEFSSNVGVTVDSRHVYAADDQGRVTEFARDTGAALWRNDKLSYRQLSTPVALSGKAVAVGDYQGYIHFLSQDDGSFVSRISTDGSPVLATPVASDKNVIFQTQAGTLVALTAE